MTTKVVVVALAGELVGATQITMEEAPEKAATTQAVEVAIKAREADLRAKAAMAAVVMAEGKEAHLAIRAVMITLVVAAEMKAGLPTTGGISVGLKKPSLQEELAEAEAILVVINNNSKTLVTLNATNSLHPLKHQQ